MALRNIVVEGDPVLRKVCRPVDKVDDRIRMIFDLILEKGFERVVIHFPILLHRRDKGNTGTSED